MKFLVAVTLALTISYVKADGAHSHEHAHAPAHDSYGPPEPTYGAPAPSYGAPAPTYEEPVVYEHHEVYEEEGGFEIIVVIIIACISMIGLGLLFPTHVQVLSGNLVTPAPAPLGRKKRYAEEIARSDFIGRTAEIYENLNRVLDPVDRRCMEKLTCEVGSLSYDAGLTNSPFLKLVVPFVPGKYEKYMKHFIYANNCHKIKCSAF